MRSPNTEANHLGFTKPPSCLLLCNYVLVRHNRNSSDNVNGRFMQWLLLIIWLLLIL